MNAPLQIMPATANDAKALCALVNSAYRGDSSRQGWTTEADLLDGIRIDEATMNALLHNEDMTILKAIFKNDIVGSVHLEHRPPVMYLGMLTVKPDLQDGGIGAQLLQTSEEWALEKGCTSIEMTVISVRQSLIAWYERKGYRQTGEQKPFPTDPRFGIPKQPLHFVVLQKEILH